MRNGNIFNGRCQGQGQGQGRGRGQGQGNVNGMQRRRNLGNV